MPSKSYEILDEGILKNINHNKMTDNKYRILLKRYEHEYYTQREAIEHNRLQYEPLRKWEMERQHFRNLSRQDPYKP